MTGDRHKRSDELFDRLLEQADKLKAPETALLLEALRHVSTQLEELGLGQDAIVEQIAKCADGEEG